MPKRTTKRSKLGYMVQGQSEGQRRAGFRDSETADASSREGVRSPKVTVNTKKEHHEEGTSQELEAGGNGEMCKHARLILTWSAGYIMTPS